MLYIIAYLIMDNTVVYIIGIGMAILLIVGIFWSAHPDQLQNTTSPQKQGEVVIYVAHDQDYSEPILREFINSLSNLSTLGVGYLALSLLLKSLVLTVSVSIVIVLSGLIV